MAALPGARHYLNGNSSQTMNFQGLVPVLQCQNIEQTLAFYQRALRYIIVNKTDGPEGLQWVHLKSDNTFLMLQNASSTSDNQPGSGKIVLHYYTSDVAAQHQFMTARGIKVGEIENTPYYMTQFLVRDPEGNEIVIGQDTRKHVLADKL